MKLTGMEVAILTAEDGVERVELTEPRGALEAAEAHVVRITPQGGKVRTFDQTDPSETRSADRGLGSSQPTGSHRPTLLWPAQRHPSGSPVANPAGVRSPPAPRHRYPGAAAPAASPLRACQRGF